VRNVLVFSFVLSSSFALWNAGNVWCKREHFCSWLTEIVENFVSAEDSANYNVFLNSVCLIEPKVLFEMNDTLQHGNVVILCSLQRRRELLMWRSCCFFACNLVSANKPFDEFTLILNGGLPLKFRQLQFLTTLTHNKIHEW
jgi:hypothetical protein